LKNPFEHIWLHNELYGVCFIPSSYAVPAKWIGYSYGNPGFENGPMHYHRMPPTKILVCSMIQDITPTNL
jgi:hypothetical protein